MGTGICLEKDACFEVPDRIERSKLFFTLCALVFGAADKIETLRGRHLGPQSPMKRAEGCPTAGVGGDAIPEGKDSVLCGVLKSRLCPRSQRGAHSVLPGGPGASGWRLSGLPRASSGPSPTPSPEMTGFCRPKSGSVTHGTHSLQTAFSLSLPPPRRCSLP